MTGLSIVPPRFVVKEIRGKLATWFRVVDTQTGRIKGQTDSFRDGEHARELCDIQCRALNQALK